ncbi:hypothetical protein KIMH_10180 [Bombiscardovia apis]|uniref:Antitoxin VbhA domain-containing protein n=1 Tax=Bombiscardovia apis TaxID=2932182 RepID=A0ABN6SHZ5_9BIFI|nr:antitoxin VbhA family protein [Bombiscardovia apis]BDR54907.1 hypothetical protein KIMH_10180 [Bombiscardovia apis]
MESGERRRRLMSVAGAIHSARMEGGDVSPQFCRDAQDFIEGRIDSHALVSTTRARYGLE